MFYAYLSTTKGPWGEKKSYTTMLVYGATIELGVSFNWT